MRPFYLVSRWNRQLWKLSIMRGSKNVFLQIWVFLGGFNKSLYSLTLFWQVNKPPKAQIPPSRLGVWSSPDREAQRHYLLTCGREGCGWCSLPWGEICVDSKNKNECLTNRFKWTLSFAAVLVIALLLFCLVNYGMHAIGRLYFWTLFGGLLMFIV